MDKPYTFEGPDGPASLLGLFEGRLQLVMHHFMLSPDWDTACSSCSSAARPASGTTFDCVTSAVSMSSTTEHFAQRDGMTTRRNT